MNRFIVRVLLFLQIAVTHAASFNHAAWDELLQAHVVSVRNFQATQVDYSGLKAQQKNLQGYLAATSAVKRADFERWSKNEQLAFLINSYNAWTVSLVLTEYPQLKSIKDLGSIFQSPWKKTFISLLGEMRSLDDIEHKLIRGSGRYNEPRIHFAVNCASIGCPALRGEAYQAQKLESQLDDATRLFLADRTRNRVVGNTLEVSSIFKWYREDFEKGWRDVNRLNDFFAVYHQALGVNAKEAANLKNMSIEFLDYDRRLNRTP